jgi:hypothetical protein
MGHESFRAFSALNAKALVGIDPRNLSRHA